MNSHPSNEEAITTTLKLWLTLILAQVFDSLILTHWCENHKGKGVQSLEMEQVMGIGS